MLALVTWTTHGTWLAGPARGRTGDGGGGGGVPEPDAATTAERSGSLKWPAVRLGAGHHAAIIEDLPRIAALRGFDPRVLVIAGDHVHLLLTCPDDRDLLRLVQLVKGALSRALSVAEGDEAARTEARETLPHHKWWSRQHSVVAVPDEPAAREAVVTHLTAHGADEGTTVVTFGGPG